MGDEARAPVDRPEAPPGPVPPDVAPRATEPAPAPSEPPAPRRDESAPSEGGNGDAEAAGRPAATASAEDGRAQATPPAEGEPPATPGATDAPDGELEELSLPALARPPEALAPDSVVDPAGRLRVVGHRETRGRVNHYAATWQEDGGVAAPVELREASVDHDGLRREAEVLGSTSYAMLPRLYASLTADGRRYLAVEPLDGETLADALDRGLDVGRAISIVLQLAQVLRQLHHAGWALVGLTPSDVVLGNPIRLRRLDGAARLGDVPPLPIHVPGYSAPELARGAPVTGKEDVYALGAILYRVLAGRPIPESGVEPADLPGLVPVPGAPQVLGAALAPVDQRVDLDEFYRRLLELKRREARTALALEAASATTIGLNPTRATNEDSCGFLAWSQLTSAGPVFRAILCVADGMGGMQDGEVASGTALAVILRGARDAIAPEAAAPDPTELVKQAATAVYAAAAGRSVGTTVTCVAVEDGVVRLAHVGDTRAYLLREGTLRQLTADHSLVAAMVASGVLTKDQARGHPDSNKVLRDLGSQRVLPDGYVDDLSATHPAATLALQPDDWLVLCTDGVWGQLDDGQIAAAILGSTGPAAAAAALVDRTIRAGAPDNATAVVARCVAAAAP